jgi:hypothetical protein
MRAGGRGIRVLALAVAALAPACGESDSIVIVKVAADSDVGAVIQLRALVSNAGDGTARLFPGTPAPAPIRFETSFSLGVARDRTGALDIALDGLDSGGAVIANGAGTVDLRGGDNVTITITLHTGPSLCGNGQVDADEGCDDGDRLSKGACDYLCQPRTGGPGVGGMGGTGGTGGAAGTGGSAGTGGAGGRPCVTELLTSGGFDASNTRWTQVTRSRALIYDEASVPTFVPAPHTRPRLAWLGYDAASDVPALRQNISIPADALQVNISGYYQIQTEESGCQCDKAFVELDVGGNITKLAEWNNENANTSWSFFSTFVNGAAVAGQTITFQLRVEMDDGVNTSFYFDSLSVTADSCP